ncbi:hypothetical protein LJC58_08610 [Lachnospiraceae bacterium OttesenSCG-928-D06]|nr:hypothetical protein [Lachnospiraceae bacterium OttesenSCG-928-D06]
MDLVIKYDNGQMTVHLEEFLGQISISKFRKLVKLINSSYTPELLDDLKSYILNQLEQFEPQKQEYENMVIGYESKIPLAKKNVNDSIFKRDVFKRGTERYKLFSEGVKESRQELTHLNSCVRNYKQKINNCIRNKDFYSKCIEIIS